MANDPRNISTKTTAQRMAALINSYYAKKTDLPTKVSELTNDSNYQSAEQVQTAINNKIASVYKPGGSKGAADLTSALLVAANEGKVYNMTEAFTTTADFVEGAGKKYKAGVDVAVINVSETDTPEYKFNVFANFVDLSGYIEKVSPATAGNLTKQKADGSLEDAGIAADNVATKPASAVADHLAKFDANKNAIDSGIDVGDVQQKLNSFTSGNIRTSDANGFAQDGGVAAADLQQKLASGAFTEGNIRKTNAQGFAEDAGIAADDVLTVNDISDYTEAELRTLLGLPAAE